MDPPWETTVSLERTVPDEGHFSDGTGTDVKMWDGYRDGSGLDISIEDCILPITDFGIADC
jgi:hypothetical protein